MQIYNLESLLGCAVIGHFVPSFVASQRHSWSLIETT